MCRNLLSLVTESGSKKKKEYWRHWRHVHGEYLANLHRGPIARPTPRILTEDQAGAASAGRDLRRRESQVLQRRLAHAITYSEDHSFKELVEELETVVAEYLVGLPEPDPITTFFTIEFLLSRASLELDDTAVFPSASQLQRPTLGTSVVPGRLLSVIQYFNQRDDAIVAAEQMLWSRKRRTVQLVREDLKTSSDKDAKYQVTLLPVAHGCPKKWNYTNIIWSRTGLNDPVWCNALNVSMRLSVHGQRRARRRVVRQVPAHPIPTTSQPFFMIGCDAIGLLEPTTKVSRYMLVAVDYPVKSPENPEIAELVQELKADSSRTSNLLCAAIIFFKYCEVFNKSFRLWLASYAAVFNDNVWFRMFLSCSSWFHGWPYEDPMQFLIDFDKVAKANPLVYTVSLSWNPVLLSPWLCWGTGLHVLWALIVNFSVEDRNDEGLEISKNVERIKICKRMTCLL